MIELETGLSIMLALFAIFTVFGMTIMFPLVWLAKTIFHS